MGTTTNDTAPYLCTVNMKSKTTTGIATLEFVAVDEYGDPETAVLSAGSDYLVWTMVVNGTVKVGSPVLTVDVSPAGKGDVKIDGAIPGSYPDVSNWAWDEVVDLEAVDSVAGWGFDEWSGDLSGDTNPTTITMSDAKSVTANFVELPPDIGVSPDSLSFVTYEGVNPPDDTFDITNIGGQTLCWALGSPPTWTTGDNWVLVNTYTPYMETLTMAVTDDTDPDVYTASASWTPVANRLIDVTGMGIIQAQMISGIVQVDKYTFDTVQQDAVLSVNISGTWVPATATLTWDYIGCHGWPYYGGKSWAYVLNQALVVGGSPAPPVPPITAYAVVSNYVPVTTAGNLSFMCWEITHFLTDPMVDTFMQTYWSDDARNFVEQGDGGTYVYPPMDLRSLLAYSVAAPAPPVLPAWLSASPATGTLVGNGASETVTVSVDAAGANLTVGDYNATIIVSAPGSILEETVAVSLTVKPATYIPSMRDLPGDALEFDQTYAGETFDVYVNFTSSADGLNSIGLTDVAPDGWIVQVDKTWCTPNAYAVQKWGNEVEILWSGPYGVGQDFSAMYKVTVPDTAKPGINTWEVCPDMNEAWLEYYFGEDGPHKACISGEYQLIVTVPGDVVGETRDVNANELGDVVVTLLKDGEGALTSDPSTPDYSNTAYTTGMYWQVATKALFYTIDMCDMAVLPDKWIDLSTPELLSAGCVFDFEANYGLVPRACDMWYAQKSVNLWLFPPAEEFDIYGTVINSWGIDEWKALDSIHSWQFPS